MAPLKYFSNDFMLHKAAAAAHAYQNIFEKNQSLLIIS
jgi:hypothetical protein